MFASATVPSARARSFKSQAKEPWFKYIFIPIKQIFEGTSGIDNLYTHC